MTELGELEARHEDFEKRGVQVVVASIEPREKAQETQKVFPHLIVLADSDRRLAETMDVIHPHSAPDGGDTAAPTTILLDEHGVVRWVFRPGRVITRLSPDEVLAALDKHVLGK